jgi:hypothetical protein
MVVSPLVWPLVRPGLFASNQRIPHALFYVAEFTGILRHNRLLGIFSEFGWHRAQWF